MSDLVEADPSGRPVAPLLRDRSGAQRITNIELFFSACLLMLTRAEGAFPAGPKIWKAGNTRNAGGGTAPDMVTVR